MTSMSQLCGRRALAWPMVLALVCAVGCSRPTGVPTAGSAQTDQTPFHDQSTGPARDNTGESAETQTDGSSHNGLPFHESQNLPAGTLLTIRLNSPVTARDSVTEISFHGVVDEPVVLEGNTVIPRGTAVAGRIESARISKMKRDRGYVRLALESVHIGGLDMPVQTASLFARQSPQSNAVIRLEKGRRLTFRLTEPLSLTTQRAQVGH